MVSYEDRLNDQFSDVLRSPIRAASAAGLERNGLVLKVIGAALVGLVLAQFIDWAIPQSMVVGLFAGLGLAFVMSRDHRRMLASDAQPGGGAVVLAVTDSDLVVLERSMWTLKAFGVLAQVPFESVRSVSIPDRPRSKPVTFTLTDGGRWRYLIPQWSALLSALPDHLRT